MIFNSFLFVWLFPIIFFVYWIFSSFGYKGLKLQKASNLFLIIISYGLYLKYNPIYVLILLSVTVITYLAALKIEKDKAFGKKKYIVFFGILLASIPLLLFKYYNFINDTLASLMQEVGITIGLPGLNWVMPLGISFYTLQAIGYLADVYLQRIKAEHNWWDYMLFVCFFPQIASGPISKASNLLPQIKACRVFKYEQAVQGLKWLLWGMFLKVVVADRIGLIVNDTYIHMLTNTGLNLFMASLFYATEVYCDFCGYSLMALGVGEILGFELVNNFRQPFLSQSITEFWRRWHISLSTWLKDYIYIPLGGSRCSKKRNYFNIMVTFVVSGLWHGANWNFVVWGAFHGVVQVFEKIFGLNKKDSNGFVKFLRVSTTFLLFSFSMIFFYLHSISDAYYVISKILTDFSGSISPWYFCLVLSTLVMFNDIVIEFDIKPLRFLESKYVLVRWAAYLFLIIMIMTMGVYGGQFIYSGF